MELTGGQVFAGGLAGWEVSPSQGPPLCSTEARPLQLEAMDEVGLQQQPPMAQLSLVGARDKLLPPRVGVRLLAGVRHDLASMARLPLDEVGFLRQQPMAQLPLVSAPEKKLDPRVRLPPAGGGLYLASRARLATVDLRLDLDPRARLAPVGGRLDARQCPIRCATES